MITGAARGLGYEFCNALIQACVVPAIWEMQYVDPRHARGIVVALNWLSLISKNQKHKQRQQRL